VPPPRDPRYRPFRFTLWIAYFLAITLSIGAFITSIVKHLSGPTRVAASGAVPTRATLRVCVEELQGLNKEQNERAWKLGAEIGQTGAVAAFEGWARDWEQRIDDLEDRCRIDATDPDPQGFGGRVELARARDAVLALHRAYRAQVNRFAQEEADLARAAARALDVAHEASREATGRRP